MLVFDRAGTMEQPAHFVLLDWSGSRIVAIRDSFSLRTRSRRSTGRGWADSGHRAPWGAGAKAWLDKSGSPRAMPAPAD